MAADGVTAFQRLFAPELESRVVGNIPRDDRLHSRIAVPVGPCPRSESSQVMLTVDKYPSRPAFGNRQNALAESSCPGRSRPADNRTHPG